MLISEDHWDRPGIEFPAGGGTNFGRLAPRSGMGGTATEGTLRDWRFGQTEAERLVAGLLQLEGFEEIDPQHPLGGPDGLKDVLCTRKGVLWVAAAYFPPTRATFSAIRKKFLEDVAGVAANGAAGFAFFVNQPLSDTERKRLKNGSPAASNEIYRLERIFHLLNSARGAGLRLQHLRIPMTAEDQWSYQTEANAALSERMKFVGGALERLEVRTRAIQADLGLFPRRSAGR